MRTELGSSFAIDSDVGPVIWPIHFLIPPERENGLDGEGHARFADTRHFALAIVRDPWRRMELSVNAMATPGRDDFAASGFCVRLNDSSEVSKRCARLHHGNCLVQAFTRGFNELYRVRVRLGSVADVVRFVQVSVVTPVIDRDVEVEDVTVQENALVGYTMADHFVCGSAQGFRKVVVVQRRRI